MKTRESSFRHVEELIKSEMPRGSYGCVTLSNELLKSTGHIPVSTNIARGVMDAFLILCFYQYKFKVL